MHIRLAQPADVPDLLAIYAPYVTDTVISFEYDVPTEGEFARRVASIQERLPYLVAEVDGRVAGYAYASPHSDRAAYQWSVNTSVYIHADYHRRGLARQLYTELFARLRRLGYVNAYAGITLPNPGSEALHRAMGFTPVGVYTNVGYKFGAWHSVEWLEMALQPRPEQPAVPLPITDS